MKRFLVCSCFFLITIFLLLIITPSPVLSANGDGNNVDVLTALLFSWARSPINWTQGLIFSLTGLVGGLITIFTLIGGTIPGTYGQAQIEIDRERLERISRTLEVLIQSQDSNAEKIHEVENAANNLRDDLRAERWRQFTTASLLYGFLAAFFSAALATNLLQAIVIGAGWTSFLGSVGLQSDFRRRKEFKDEALENALPIIEAEEARQKQNTNIVPDGLENHDETIVAPRFSQNKVYSYFQPSTYLGSVDFPKLIEDIVIARKL